MYVGVCGKWLENIPIEETTSNDVLWVLKWYVMNTQLNWISFLKKKHQFDLQGYKINSNSVSRGHTSNIHPAVNFVIAVTEQVYNQEIEARSFLPC